MKILVKMMLNIHEFMKNEDFRSLELLQTKILEHVLDKQDL